MRSKGDDPSALHVVLFQEVERYNALLVGVRRSCVELQKGIQGLVVMSADLDQVGGRGGKGSWWEGVHVEIELQNRGLSCLANTSWFPPCGHRREACPRMSIPLCIWLPSGTPSRVCRLTACTVHDCCSRCLTRCTTRACRPPG